MEKRCTNCGSKRLAYKEYRTPRHEGLSYVPPLSLSGLNSYVCLDCGHVEFFDTDPKGYEKKLEENRAKELRAKQEREKREKEKAELDNRISELKNIIDNLDSTQRQVNEAKQELHELENKRRNF